MSADRSTRQSWNAVSISPDDDVAVALRALKPGETLVSRGGTIDTVPVTDAIAMGHKFALRAIAAGEPVRKYGEVIGIAMSAIARGAHVHVHNLRSLRARTGTG